MRKLMDLPAMAFDALSGNVVAQTVLQRNVVISQRLMGIGAGADVATSGERSIFRMLTKRCDPPYCVFDVGANKGQFLDLTISAMATSEYTIHSFEPGAETFQILSTRQPDRRVRLNNMAIGQTQATRTLFYDAPGSGMASLTKRDLEHRNIEFDKSETIRVETIDSYCSENKIDRIHLLKVDIEGHELDAFEGARSMFDRRAIDLVTFEFGGCNIDTHTTFRQFWNFFAAGGMSLYRITPSGYLCRIPKYKEVHEQYRTTNFVAVLAD